MIRLGRSRFAVAARCWTLENRCRYDRATLRYPSDLTDAEWAWIELFIPPAKRGGNSAQLTCARPRHWAGTRRNHHLGGGVPLYQNGRVIGGLGVSGDSSCADHAIAVRMRKLAGFDGTSAGPNGTGRR